MAVTRFEILARRPFADGESFGSVGPYEQLDGLIHFEVDARSDANRAIVDLDLAAGPDGRANFSADFSLVTPVDFSRGSRKLLVDVPNRGNRLTAPTLHRVPALTPEDRLKPGDGFLCHLGFSYISVGWQWDAEGDHALRLYPPTATEAGRPIDGQVVMKLQPASDRAWLPLVQLGQTLPPYPVSDPLSPEHRLFVRAHENDQRSELPRESWRFAREKGGVAVPSDRHILLEGGFQRGLIYELVYLTRGAPVVGAGLLSVRDATACLAHGDRLSPLPAGFSHTYGFGVSQTGRFLRQFLYDGLNVDEAGRKVFDGLWIHIAGAQRGDFNFRFAQPTVANVPSLGQRFPFAMSRSKDLFSDTRAGLLDNLDKAYRPRIIVSNTSWEYWRGDASLGHILGDQDLPECEDVRIYMVAGTHHIGGILVKGKQLTELAATGLKVAMPLNVVNAAPVSRALIVALDEWVDGNVAPPPSRHPRLDDGTAVLRSEVLSAFAGEPRLAAEKLASIRFQPPRPENRRGRVTHPVEETGAYPCYVSAVNDDLNEVAGIILPDLALPLGVHTGWNPRGEGTGAEDQAAIFAGFTRFFAAAEVRARYGNEDAYLDAVGRYTDTLIEQRFILQQDRDWMIELARDRYRAATRD